MRRALTLLLVLLLAGCSAGGSPKPEPTNIGGLQTFTEEPTPRHTTHRVTYDHTPPAGGKHWPPGGGGVKGWLRCGVYDAPVPNEFAVHSEEHGAVWLTYQPGKDATALTKLYDARKDYVLVSPYPGQPGTYMASTWGAQLTVDSGDDPRLKSFLDSYAGGGQGGEKGADCAHGDLPATAAAALVKANPGS